jgi:hypothetical protein
MSARKELFSERYAFGHIADNYLHSANMANQNVPSKIICYSKYKNKELRHMKF